MTMLTGIFHSTLYKHRPNYSYIPKDPVNSHFGSLSTFRPDTSSKQVHKPSPLRANECEFVSYPTDRNYMKMPDEKFGFLGPMRTFLRMDNRKMLPSALRPGQLGHRQWSKLSYKIEHRHQYRKNEIVHKLARDGINGDIRALRKVVKLAYNDKVHDLATSLIPFLYMKYPEHTAAACTEAMAKFDPVLESMVLQERATQVSLQLKDEKSSSNGKKSWLPFSGNSRLHNEDSEIKERLKQLVKAPKTPSIVALLALQDGYDRRVTYAAHTVLHENRFCDQLGIRSPEEAFRLTREIKNIEAIARRKVHDKLPVTYKGSARMSGKQMRNYITRYKHLYKQNGGNTTQAEVVTIIDHKDRNDVKTLVLFAGKAAVLRPYKFGVQVERKLYSEILIDHPMENLFPNTTTKYMHQMFGVWMTHAYTDTDDPSHPRDIILTTVKRWKNRSDQQKMFEIMGLRLSLKSDLRQNSLPGLKDEKRTDFLPWPKPEVNSKPELVIPDKSDKVDDISSKKS